MRYFEEASTLPPPFNVIPTPKMFLKIFGLREKDKLRKISAAVILFHSSRFFYFHLSIYHVVFFKSSSLTTRLSPSFLICHSTIRHPLQMRQPAQPPCCYYFVHFLSLYTSYVCPFNFFPPKILSFVSLYLFLLLFICHPC